MPNYSETILCPVCSSNVKLYKKLKKVAVYGSCSTCGHRFTDIKSIEKQEDYSDDYYEKIHSNWFENPNIKLFHAIFDIINNHNSEAEVLDVGCGNGEFLKFLSIQSDKMKPVGIDFHENNEENGIEFYSGDISETDFGRKFDIIVNLAVIEHIWNVSEYMSRLFSLCKDGGLIITMTVNDNSIIYLIARLLNFFGIKEPIERLYEKHHLNHFSRKSLRFLMVKTELKIDGYINTLLPIEAVDAPKKNKFMGAFYMISLRVLLFFEYLTKKSILQTIVVKK